MDRWLQAALDYIPSYLDYQLRMQHHPGCVIAVAQRGKVVSEHALGFANLATGEPLTPRHRFRIASHSKSFTAAGLMKLRDQDRVHLDARVGDYVKGLHAKSARKDRSVAVA
jgi:CubicO group peptidase (beta-lactamase class C family)